MRFLVSLLLSYFCTSVVAQDTISFKINNGGASEKDLVYSIGDLLSSLPNSNLTVFPLVALPKKIITGFHDERSNSEIKVSIFPNPVAQVLSINSGSEKGKLLLFDVSGRKIKETNWPTEFSMQDFAAGEYFLILISETKSTQNFKIIKQ